MSATDEKTSRRVVSALSAIYFEPGPDYEGRATTRVKTALRGDEIELTEHEERRLEENGALMPLGSTPEEALEAAAARLDAYRAARGDGDAQGRHQERMIAAARAGTQVDDGGIVNVTLRSRREQSTISLSGSRPVSRVSTTPWRSQRVIPGSRGRCWMPRPLLRAVSRGGRVSRSSSRKSAAREHPGA